MSLVRSLSFRAACALGLPRISRRFHRKELVILGYHGVHPGDMPGDRWHFLPSWQFERQLKYLKDNYEIVDLDVGLDALFDGRLKRPTAAITFDDGYLNNLTVAFPILASFGIPVTIFLTTGLIGSGRSLWTFQIEGWFQNATETKLDLNAWGLGIVSLADTPSRRRVARRLIHNLKALGPRARLEAMADLREQLAPGTGELDPSLAMMNWDQVRSLEDTGLVRFGAHTVDHEIVSRLSDLELEQQIGGACSAISENLRSPSQVFAYPNGRKEDFDTRASQVLVDCGQRYAVSTIEGLNKPDSDPFSLRRVVIGNENSLENVKLRTSGFSMRQ